MLTDDVSPSARRNTRSSARADAELAVPLAQRQERPCWVRRGLGGDADQGSPTRERDGPAAAMTSFVCRTTLDYSDAYVSPGGGRDPRLGRRRPERAEP